MLEKVREYVKIACDIIEFIVAILTLIAIVVVAVRAIPVIMEGFSTPGTESLMTFLQEIFVIIIAIEFIKMLCKPNAANVIEVLVFVVSRHMIISESTPLEDLISIIGVGILLFMDFFIKYKVREKYQDENKEL
ncbi:MAG: hypothetical protein K6F30_11415 [Lachnospiraceae bacterium]|nr:hypothetical protein [Lachnospiraceae bacterium]